MEICADLAGNFEVGAITVMASEFESLFSIDNFNIEDHLNGRLLPRVDYRKSPDSVNIPRRKSAAIESESCGSVYGSFLFSRFAMPVVVHPNVQCVRVPVDDCKPSINIGDPSCVYNAKSPYLRCAVNPDGNCGDCPHFEKEI